MRLLYGTGMLFAMGLTLFGANDTSGQQKPQRGIRVNPQGSYRINFDPTIHVKMGCLTRNLTRYENTTIVAGFGENDRLEAIFVYPKEAGERYESSIRMAVNNCRGTN